MAAENPIVSREAWLEARRALLVKEKEAMRAQDALRAEARALPAVRVEKDYAFEGPEGTTDLAGLFDGRDQLVVYHFMLGPGWEAGCPSCSFVTDHLVPMQAHLRARGVTLVLVSRAPLSEIQAFQQRMGWNIPWYSSHGSDFNGDYDVSGIGPRMDDGTFTYNFRPAKPTPGDEMPGLSVFARHASGGIVHTYSTYSRGLDTFIGTYRILDIVPSGRNEEGLDFAMAWVRHHDRYEDAPEGGCCH